MFKQLYFCVVFVAQVAKKIWKMWASKSGCQNVCSGMKKVNVVYVSNGYHHIHPPNRCLLCFIHSLFLVKNIFFTKMSEWMLLTLLEAISATDLWVCMLSSWSRHQSSSSRVSTDSLITWFSSGKKRNYFYRHIIIDKGDARWLSDLKQSHFWIGRSAIWISLPPSHYIFATFSVFF